MPAERTDMHTLQELVRLHRLGKPVRTVARLLHIGPNTERKYRLQLAAAGLLDGAPDSLPPLSLLVQATQAAAPRPVPQPSRLAPYSDQVSEWLRRGKRPRAIFDALRTHDPDFPGSYSAVKRLCRRIQKQAPIAPQSVRIPVETAPGEVAQVDFGYVGLLYDPDAGILRKAWVFVLVLGFSRKLFARIVFDQSTATWLRLHQEAFADLGGVVRTVVPDNLKAAVLRAAFGADRDALALNKSYREQARHYGFVIDPTPVRTPEHKAYASYCTSCVLCVVALMRTVGRFRSYLPFVLEWGIGAWGLVQVVVAIAVGVSAQQAAPAPDPDGQRLDPQESGHFCEGEHAALPQSVEAALQVILGA